MPRNAFIMNEHHARRGAGMGTAARAMRLGRSDLAGKTGTTNDFIDAWFSGYSRTLWPWPGWGSINRKTLGRNETGGNTALPIWIDYMAVALKNVPEEPFSPPAGVMVMQIDPETGVRAAAGGISEYFYQEFPAPDAAPLRACPATEKRPLTTCETSFSRRSRCPESGAVTSATRRS
jgi:penicillin-binding protein 1A